LVFSQKIEVIYLKIPRKIEGKLDPALVEKAKSIGNPRKISNKKKDNDYLAELRSSPNIKEKTNDILWEVYNKEGFSRFSNLISYLKSFGRQDFNDLIQVKGEIAEVVLEITISHFIKKFSLPWKVYRTLIIPYSSSSSSSTELDLILLTPQVVTVFEVKSYNGEKTITGDCFMKAVNHGVTQEKDIFSQNKLHIKAFWMNFGNYAKGETGVIKSVMFSFATGKVIDMRDPAKKIIMPIYDESTISSYLEALRQINFDPRWESDLVNAIDKAKASSISLEDHISNINSRTDSTSK